MRILLVEDNPMNTAFFRAALEPGGHLIEAEANGEDGLTRALAGAFELIVLDIELPGIRGDELCERLRAAGHREPILALTASALPDQLADLSHSGFDLVLTKPIDPDKLRFAVARFDPASRV